MENTLSLKASINIMLELQKLDSTSTCILCALPEEQSFTIIPMRQPDLIAEAIASTNLTPIAHIGTIDLVYLQRIEDHNRFISIMLEMLTKREHFGSLINILEAYNTYNEDPEAGTEKDGIQE